MTNTPDKTVEAVARAIDRSLWLILDHHKDKGIDLSHDYRSQREGSLARSLAAIKAHTECLMEPSEEKTSRCSMCNDTGEVQHPTDQTVMVLCPKSCPASMAVLHQEFSKEKT